MFGHIAFCYACYFRALKTPLLQPFSVEDIAASFADSTRSVVGHAQTSLETAQRNWSSLLAETSKWADDAGFALRGATTSTRLENTFGDLWNDAMPSFNKSRVCVDRLSIAMDESASAAEIVHNPSFLVKGRHFGATILHSCPWSTKR
jgi:hypothetical protein